MTVTVLYEGQVCQCCAMWLANNDDSGCDLTTDATQHPHGLMGMELGGYAVLNDDEEYSVDDFSSARCDGCGTYLAGQRHSISVLSD